MALLVLKDAEKVYPGGNRAIDHLSLTVQKGEFIVIVGRNGSGKSTLLRMIAGLEDVSNGELFLDGKAITNTPTKNRDVALMTQSNAPNANNSVYDNLAHGLKMRKISPDLIDVRVNATAELFGLTADLQKKPKALSALARRRIALGRIVAREPKVVLFDEPFSNLDDELRGKMLSDLVKLNTRLKSTFLYATDNISEAMTLATRIIVMRDGKIEQDGTPLELYDQPKNRFVADLIGSPSVNLFDGATLQFDDNTAYVDFYKQRSALPQSVADRLDTVYRDGEKKKVCLAVRAEDISLGGDILAKVERVDGKYAQCELNYQSDRSSDRIKITARLDGVQAGEEVKLAFDAARMFLFDEDTGNRL